MIFNSEIYRKGELNSPDNVVNPDSNTFEYREQARNDFMNFVLETYSRLLSIEVKTIGSRSTLSVFCRIDVGLFLDANGKASYFVNEVERTLTTSLWVRDRDIPINSVSSTIGKSLHTWINRIISI